MRTGIPEEIIEKVRKENDIVDVIEEYVQLKKQGRNYFGLCPFHDEKTPSFSVTKDKQIFHCFGCGKGGNVITFLMEVEHVPFLEAVHILAKRIDLSLPVANKQQPTYSQETNTLLSAYEWLTKYYHHLLKYSEDGKDGLAYLEKRGIDEKTIDQFQLGFSPTQSEITVDFLKQKGFHEQLLVKAGLLTTRDNIHFNDAFRGRVIFPIFNHLGRTVAFGGRSFSGEEPKYLNSPEHELFKKRNLLFHFHAAKNHIRKQNEVIIFEGYMDVLAAQQAGIKNSVATLGTALTATQAKLLHRYVDSVIICYDGDEAGIHASYEAAILFNDLGTDVKIAQIKDGLDPDDFIRKYGSDSFKTDVIDTSDTFFKFYMQYKKREFNLSIDSERISYLELMTNELAKIDSPIEREYYIKEIADEFNLSEEIIADDVQQSLQINYSNLKDNREQNSNTNTNITFQHQQKMMPAYWRAEKRLLAHMLKHPRIIELVQEKLGVQFNIEEHKIILTHLYALYEEHQNIDVSKLVEKLGDPHIKKTFTEIAFTQVNDHITDAEINDYIQIIYTEATEKSYLRSLKRKQKQEKNPIIAAQIGLEIIELEKHLKNMK